jgi:hypothetical protein
LCYNKDTKKEKEIKKMKFRVVHPAYQTSYFPTLGAAILYRRAMGGVIEHLDGGVWVSRNR